MSGENLKPKGNCLRVSFEGGQMVKKKYCRCNGCGACGFSSGCDKLIAVYPGPLNPEDPDGAPMTLNRFNPLQFCPECRQARRGSEIAGWKRVKRMYTRGYHDMIRAQAKSATEAVERMEEALRTADQVIENYRAEIRRLGGDPDGGKRDGERGGVLRMIERIVKGGS